MNTDIETIHLRYTNDNWATNTALELRCLRNDAEPVTDRISGTTLRGRDYSHRRWHKTERLLVISADELSTAATYTFAKEFYKAGAWGYSENGTDWTEVVLKEAGRLPVSYIEDWTDLPELSLTLIDKEPG